MRLDETVEERALGTPAVIDGRRRAGIPGGREATRLKSFSRLVERDLRFSIACFPHLQLNSARVRKQFEAAAF